MLEKILMMDELVMYVLAAELLLLWIAQLRTNGLLKKHLKLRTQKKEAVKQLKEEVKKEPSEIPVMKFEKPEKPKEQIRTSKSTEGMDPKDAAVLQEMMAEFFG